MRTPRMSICIRVFGARVRPVFGSRCTLGGPVCVLRVT